jgi:hypothetical protein
MSSGDKVLSVAGHRGTWALALAKAGAKVTYSELSQELTTHATKHVTHRNIQGHICASYVSFPPSTNLFDWTFTFEAVGPKQFILLRSLLNSKGGKYVLWNKSEHIGRKLVVLNKTLKLCESVYGAKTSSKRKNLRCSVRDGSKKVLPHLVLTVQTNDSARTLIERDLSLLQILFRRKTANSEDLATLLACSTKEIIQSIRRLGKIAKIDDKKYSKKLILK